MSSIKQQVFKLSNEIADLPETPDVKDSFSKIKNYKNGFENIEYLGRNRNLQFLGYLLINDQKDKINSIAPIQMSGLDKDIIANLIFAHSYIKNINICCLESLKNILPSAINIIDPYWENDKKLKYYIKPKTNSELILSLVKSFHESKMFKLLIKFTSLIPQIKKIDEKNLFMGLQKIKMEIAKMGLKKCPDEIFQIGLNIRNPRPESVVGAIFLILLYLSNSLTNIDQFIFQSFLDSKLNVFDINNIYNISSMGSHSLSDYYSLDTYHLFPKIGEILILNLPPKMNIPKKEKIFCRTENISMKFSQDFGNEFNVGLRAIDENFSTFSNLLRTLNV